MPHWAQECISSMMPPIAASMRAASWAVTGSTSLSAWWFIGSPHFLQIIFLPVLAAFVAMPPPILVERDVVFDPSGKLLEEAYVRRTDKFLKELIWMAKTLRHGRDNISLD